MSNPLRNSIRESKHDGVDPSADAPDKDALEVKPWWGWVAAIVGVAVALMAWMPHDEPTIAERRAALIDETDDEIIVSWRSGNDPSTEKTAGDVVWSTARREGFLRFTDLPMNDPRISQYQAWIADAAQDHPISASVFDVETGEKEYFVAIAPEIRVISPTAFLITIEKPGGVVVSQQDRIVVTAEVE